MSWTFCVCGCVIAHASLMDMTTGAFSHRQRAVQGLSHIADTPVYSRYYGIWHEWNVLTISKVDVLASWGGAEDGTGWELAVCPSLYMRARVTVKALCQIMGLSRGHCLSLCWCLERTRAGLDTQLLLAALHQTLRRPIKLQAWTCVFVSVLMFVLLECLFLFGLPMCAHVQLPICARKQANMCVRTDMALSSPAFPLCDEG